MTNTSIILSSEKIVIAKPGFDARTASDAQKALDSGWDNAPLVMFKGITPSTPLTSTVVIPFGLTLPFKPLCRVRMANDIIVPGSARFYMDPAAQYNLGNRATNQTLADVRIYNNRIEISGTLREKAVGWQQPTVSPTTGFSNLGDHAIPRRFYYFVFNVPFIEGV